MYSGPVPGGGRDGGYGVIRQTLFIIQESVIEMKEKENRTGKLLSRVLRHAPELAGIRLDPYGWADVNELVRGMQKKTDFSRDQLEYLVRTDGKRRYSFNADHTRVRANYGHSVPVTPLAPPEAPPEVLWHGSATRFSASIKRDGLLPGTRQYVHLSVDQDTARSVGKRHGEPVLYQVLSGQMYRDGHLFYQPMEGVWQTKQVPPKYLRYAYSL